MQTKPVLFWPGPRSDIKLYLDRDEDDFLVVETNISYELQKLYKIRRDTPIFDPFPQHGEHYREFIDHVVANDCRCHIVGLELCKDVLQALKDPSLARSPIEEILAAINPAGNSYSARATITRRARVPIDWSGLNRANIGLLAVLVFVASLIGNVLFADNGAIAAAVATFLFTVLYVCVRANFSRRSRDAAKRRVATPGPLGRLFMRRG